MLGLPRTGLHVSTRSGGRFGEDVDRPLLSDHSPIVVVHRWWRRCRAKCGYLT